MRGSLIMKDLTFVRYGIIPAHAGLTISGVLPEFLAWDHPRACGAHRRYRASMM